MNPVDEALEAKEKLASADQQEHLKLWEKWKNRPTQRNLTPLLKKFEPAINKRLSYGKAPSVSESVFAADLRKNAIEAFKTYDPSKASLSTHVNTRLRRTQRLNTRYQNVAYIPEDKAALISPIQRARGALYQEYEEEPDHRQIASYLNQNPTMVPKKSRGKITPTLVRQIQKAQIRDIPEAGFESDPVPQMRPKERQVLSMLRPSLKPDEQAVFDYMYGKSGKPVVTSTSEIARRLGKSPSQVSRLKRRIEKTFKSYL